MDDGLDATRCGKFGYDTFNGQNIPYIFRNDEKYCAYDICWWHYKKQKMNIGSKPEDFRYLKKYGMYDEEAILMNNINSCHNDSMYPLTFRRNDTLIKLNDVRDIFKYQKDCDQKLALGARYRLKNAGLVCIQLKRLDESQPDIILPYIQSDAKRFVPVEALFPQDAIPNTIHITKITGIDVMYMRFLADVLKIQLTPKPFKIPCVNIDDLQKLAGGFSVYDKNYWPSKGNTQHNVNHMINVSLLTTTCQNNNSKEAKAEDSIKQMSIQDTSADPKLSKRAESNVGARKHKIDEPQRPKKVPRQTNKKSENDDIFYDVEEIVDYTKQPNGKEMVYIKWKGYPPAYNSWEPLSSLNDALMEEFKEKWAVKSKLIKK